MKNKIYQCWKNRESFIWIGALTALFFMHPNAGASSWCLAKALHWGICPGCGIGHSIQEALHGHWSASFKQHPMGIAAVIIILNRIRTLYISPKPLSYDA